MTRELRSFANLVRAWARGALVTALAAATLACGGARGAGGDPDEVMGPADARSGRSESEALLRKGARLYASHCVGCHGEKGDGQGPAARFLDPKPRDFTSALFKYAAVEAGQLPTDEDLMRSLRRGLAGSSMPAWQLLSEESRRALVQYLKTFSPTWKERAPGTPLAVSPDPFDAADPQSLRAAVERGRSVYHVYATCWQCHAAYATQEEVNAMGQAEWSEDVPLREDPQVPVVVDDAWGGSVRSPDFTRQRLKSGSSAGDLYRTIAAGIGGTAMPTWKGSLEERDLWALAYYVKSLADRRWRAPRVVPAQPPATLPATATAGR